MAVTAARNRDDPMSRLARRLGPVSAVLGLTSLVTPPGAALLAQVAEASGAGPVDSVTTVFDSDSIPGFGAVGGVVSDALGYVYVADFRNALWRLSPDGELSLFADGFYGASGNAVGPMGYIYQSSFNGNYVSRISRTGDVETLASEGLAGPVGIAVAPDRNAYVVNCTGGFVARITPEGTVTEFARSPLMACPNGITFDDRGDLYVVNFNNTKVLKVDQAGVVTEFADVPGAGGNGHITFARGAFFVTKFRANQVLRLGRDGSVRVLAGTGQAGTEDGPAVSATFTRPNGISVGPRGHTLWVNDLVSGQGLGIGVSRVALRRIRLATLPDVLAGLDPSAGVDAVRSAYTDYHASRPDEDTSAEAVTQGYQWMSSGRIQQAIALFALNAESFPDNAAAWFHLGESYRYTGQNDLAAEHYRKALTLQPEYPQASARLTEVSGPG